MDETNRPVKIPPQFSLYAEKHGIFEMYKDMMQEVLINRPANPLNFLIDYLGKEHTDLPCIMVLGPPASGKRTVARLIASKLRCIHLRQDTIIDDIENEEMKDAALKCIEKGCEIPTQIWVQMLKERLNMFDVCRRGYVLDGFPRTREQAIAIQLAGFSPKHCVVLEAPDKVLIERADGKRIDPETQDVYHTTFDWPSNPDIQGRLEEIPGYDELHITKELEEYHRNIAGLKTCYKSVIREINADQPKPDVFAQVHVFLCSLERSVAPYTPRILFMGPSGSGKSVQAALLASKYGLINVSSGHLIKEAMVNDSKIGKAIASYIEKGMMAPDVYVIELLKERLSQDDCITKGWVLHGYPLNTDQASQLKSAKFSPNRVFFLEVPNDSIIERLMLRMTDPITGDRYHLLYNPPRLAEIRERLERHPQDEEDEVRRHLKHYHAYKEELEDYYLESLHINGDQDPHTVFETIESMTVNPLPRSHDR